MSAAKSVHTGMSKLILLVQNHVILFIYSKLILFFIFYFNFRKHEQGRWAREREREFYAGATPSTETDMGLDLMNMRS